MTLSKATCPLGALKASTAFLWNPGRAAQGMHLGLCARRELLSPWKQGSSLIPVQCAPLRHRKGAGTLYPARWWARVKMSNVTKPLSLLATTTAKERNIMACWLFQDSLFLPVTPKLQKKWSDLCTVNQTWVCHTWLGHHLQATPGKDHWLADLPGCPKCLHLFLSPTGTPLSVATTRCSYFSSHSSENLTLAPVMHLLSWQ